MDIFSNVPVNAEDKSGAATNNFDDIFSGASQPLATAQPGAGGNQFDVLG